MVERLQNSSRVPIQIIRTKHVATVQTEKQYKPSTQHAKSFAIVKRNAVFRLRRWKKN